MRNLWILYKKEMLDSVRSYKWIWVPAVFLLLGIMQPVTSYYMPEILAMSGSVPEEALALFTMPSSSEVLSQSLGQFSTIGLLVLVLAAMNTAAGERLSGTGEILLARSVSPFSIIMAKWLATMSLMTVSFGLGYSGAVYYTFQMIGAVDMALVLSSGSLYMLWLAWVVSLVLPLGTVLRGPAAAFVSLGTAALLSLLSTLFPSSLLWNPGRLSSLSSAWLMGEQTSALLPSGAALILLILSITAASMLLRPNTQPG